MNLEVLIKGLEDDESSPQIPRCFKDEVCFGHLWLNRISFLSDEEESILIPEYWETSDYSDLTSFEPNKLISVLNKVSNYLEEHRAELPLVHLLSDTQEDVLDSDQFKFGSFGHLEVSGSKCWIEGDTFVYDEFNKNGLRNKIHILNYPNEPTNIDIWIDVEKVVQISGKKYYINSITKYEQHKTTILEIINYCNQAIKLKKEIYWTFYQ